MKVVVVGGQARKIGKTSIMVGLIRGLKALAWTAVKITPNGHGLASSEAESEAASRGQAFVLTEETHPDRHGDSCRYLAAGARRSLWLHAQPGRLTDALPSLLQALGPDEHVIIESNRIMSFLNPAVYLVAIDPTRRDFKTSARQFLERADALVVVASRPAARSGPGLDFHHQARKPVVVVSPPDYSNSQLCRFVRQRLERAEAEFPFPPLSRSKEQTWRH